MNLLKIHLFTIFLQVIAYIRKKIILLTFPPPMIFLILYNKNNNMINRFTNKTFNNNSYHNKTIANVAISVNFCLKKFKFLKF